LRRQITNTQATIARLRTNENYSENHPQMKLLLSGLDSQAMFPSRPEVCHVWQNEN